jgi:hypothetical protein
MKQILYRELSRWFHPTTADFRQNASRAPLATLYLCSKIGDSRESPTACRLIIADIIHDYGVSEYIRWYLVGISRGTLKLERSKSSKSDVSYRDTASLSNWPKGRGNSG